MAWPEGHNESTCRPSFSRLQPVPPVNRCGPQGFGGHPRVQEPNTAQLVLGTRPGGGGRVRPSCHWARRTGSIHSGVGGLGSQAVLCQLAHPLHPGIGPQGVLKHKVPEHLDPRVVLRQVVIVLGRDLPHLRKGGGSEAVPPPHTCTGRHAQARTYLPITPPAYLCAAQPGRRWAGAGMKSA